MKNEFKLQLATSEEDIKKCQQVILELRPQLKDRDIWQIYQQQRKENFQIIYIRRDEIGVAFIGFRIQNMFHSGKTLYIDDLCTLSSYRSRGLAGELLKEVFSIAKKEKCDTVSLDSGHQRHEAHRLYLNAGFDISSHHFQHILNR
ncbi:GNAT family N-acetyltransferase [Membranihabitans maritimus]|uniref:GNAT family N-acetyltransferase n=1 Tax=Membranihabitans maritimus TaxID=2904244 RepID=UPI001F1CD092|nr:GNAT family N-acetyltransferase [Membranihabitans maritimus]